MSQDHDLRPTTGAGSTSKLTGPGPRDRGVFGTSWPGWLLLGLIVLGLPRTVLADLGIVEPESSWVYYVIALTPFAVWFAIAILRRTATPIRDHLVAGALYGISLIIAHEALWNVGSSLGHQPPAGAVALSEQFTSPLREVVLHTYMGGIAMMIGLGVGVVAAIIAAVANRARRR